MLFKFGRISLTAVFAVLLVLRCASSSFADTLKYTYDNVDRLEQVEYPDGSIIKYSYDNVGNRLKESRFNLTLTPSLPSPQPTGTSVDFTAGMSPPGAWEYRFWLRGSTGSWSVVQTYSTSPTWTWPSGAGDTYFVQADVREAGSGVSRDAAKVITYVRGDIPTDVTLSPDLPSPQAAATSVDFIATPTPPGTYEYRFWLRSATGSWTVVQPYSTSPTWTWPSGTADYYFVQADIRQLGSTVDRQDAASIAYTRLGESPTAVNLAPSLASPQPTDVSVDFTASPTPPGTYEYRFWLRSATGSWSVVQAYSTSPTWTWPSGTADDYFVQVDARAVGSTAERDQAASVAFGRWDIPADVSLAPSVPSPQSAGTPVDFTATPTPPGSYEYRFWMRSATGSWSVVRQYSTSNVWSWNPSGTADSYFIQVDIRQIGSNVNYNDAAVISYQLN